MYIPLGANCGFHSRRAVPCDAAKHSASTRALGVAPRRDLDFATLGPPTLCPRRRVEGASAAGGDASRFKRDAGARGTREAAPA